MPDYTRNKISTRLYQSSEVDFRRKKMQKIIFGLMGIFIFSGGGYALYRMVLPHVKQLSIFQYKSAIIESTPHVLEVEISTVIQEVVTLQKSTNIFMLDLNLLTERIKKHPWVRKARVSRLLPDRLRVEIREKKPVVLLSLDKLYFVDRYGKVIAPVGKQDLLNYPILTGINPADRKTMKHAFRLKKYYEKRSFLKNWGISEIVWSENGFLLYTQHPALEIRWGHRYYQRKMNRLEQVLKDLSQKEITPTLVDLNYSKKVVVKVSK